MGKNHGFYGVFGLLRSKLVDNKIPNDRIPPQQRCDEKLIASFLIRVLFICLYVLKDSKTKKNEKKADQGLTAIKRILKYTHN